MIINDPQLAYLLLSLPGIFGLVLAGEGVSKLIHEEKGGWVLLTTGIVFLAIVITVYFLYLT